MEPQKRFDKGTYIKQTGALPKNVLAEAYGIPRKVLNGYIEKARLFRIDRKKHFTHNQVKAIMECLGIDNIRWYVIEKYLRTQENRIY